jgi:hypothetical protein
VPVTPCGAALGPVIALSTCPTFGAAVYNLALRLADAGRHAEARAASEEAVNLQRELAAQDMRDQR